MMAASDVTSASYRLKGRAADDAEIFAFGDVHGCARQLDDLIGAGCRIGRSRPRRVVVFLGDLIDRGPDSLQAIHLAHGAGARLAADETVHLCGNHEQMLRIALADGLHEADRLDAFDLWRQNGGQAVIRQMFGAAFDLLLEDVDRPLSDTFSPWLDRLVTHYHCGGLTFVHAGLAPDIAMTDCLSRPWQEMPQTDRQASHHWAWMREPFLSHAPDGSGHHGRFVVHGHSMTPDVDPAGTSRQIERWRLNLDGGSYRTGVLRMAHVVGDMATVFEAAGGIRF